MKAAAYPAPRAFSIRAVALDARGHETLALKLARLGRLHAVVAAVDAAAESAANRRALLQETCRLAIAEGGFGAAWAGVYDPEAHRIRAIATEGLGQFALVSPLVLNGTPNDGTLLARAIVTGEPSICNNIAKAYLPASAFSQEALRRGLRAMAICPLRSGEGVSAVLILLAREAGAFGDEELKLLMQLADDLSVALTAMESGAG